MNSVSPKKFRSYFPAVRDHFDQTASQILERDLTEDERAIAHTAIVDSFEVAWRERIPFSAAFDKKYSSNDGEGKVFRSHFPDVYEVLRQKRGHIEGLLTGKSETPKRPSSDPLTLSLPPVLGLRVALNLPGSTA